MRALIAVPLLLVLAGCSGSDDPTVASPTPSPTASPTASPTPTPTPSPRPPSTSPSPKARPAAQDGDVDGDGTVDQLSATASLLTVRLSSGRTVTAPVHTDSPRAPRVLGSHDVDRDGYAEVFVLTASGASTQFATPYRFDGTRLHELLLGAGPAQLGIGGSVTHGDGFRCTAAGLLEARSAESQDGTTYTVTTTTYRLTTSRLDQVRRSTATARQGDAAVEAAYTVDCGSVSDGS